MKIHYISDTHLDFHMSEKLSLKASKRLKEILNYMFDISEHLCYDKDIAILGGDLSHSEWQIEFMFNHLTEHFAKVIDITSEKTHSFRSGRSQHEWYGV